MSYSRYYPEKLEGIETDEACQKRMDWLAGPVREYLDTKLKNDREREKYGLLDNFMKDFHLCLPNEYLSLQEKHIEHFDKLIEIKAMTGEPYENNLLDINRASNTLSICKLKFVKTILQIGLNSCSFILINLLNNPDVIIYCVDEGKYSYTKKCFDYLNESFPGRLKLLVGNSSIVLPSLRKENPNLRFNVVIIDGGIDMGSVNGDFFHSLGFVDFKDVLIFNHKGTNGLKFLWDGYVKDKHIKDVSSCFNISDKQYIGMYLKL
jgi:hypothetical protein